MSAIAIITARGGSKRIPGKNIKEFCGKPIIGYPITAALESGLFEEVMVSTDSIEIANVSRNLGAKVPFMRSEKTSGDFATTADVLKEVLGEYQKQERFFDIVCCIYPTAPFVTSSKLAAAVDLLKKEAADTVFPVTRFSFPPQRGIVIQNKKVKWLKPEQIDSRSQDLEPVYHDCGQFYCLNARKFLKSGKLFGDLAIPFIIDEMEVQDIDNFTDWKIAEIKYRMLLGETEV